MLTLLAWNFPGTAVTTGSIYKTVLCSLSDSLYIILIAVDLVYVPVFFQRVLRWLLNTHILRFRQRRKEGNLWGRKSKVKSEIRLGPQLLSESLYAH